MRRLSAALTALLLALGLTLVAGPATASITSPADGSTVRGNFTITDSGASDGTACVSGSSPQTQVRLIAGNGSGATVFNQTKSGTGQASFTLDSHAYANGVYQVRTDVRNRSGFLFCSNKTNTYTVSITIDNIVDLQYSGATTAPQNTTIPVSATLTDPNLPTSVLPGQTIQFQLVGGTTVSATTNASGVASATLPVNGSPRTTTLNVIFPGTAFYTARTRSFSFDVTKNASVTTLDPPPTVVHGEPVGFTAHVTAGNGTSSPTGTVQFKVDGSNFGAPVALVAGAATTPSTTSLSTGAHTVGASYSGDGNFLSSTAATGTATIDKASTTTTLDANPTPTVSGQAVTFTATVDVVAPGAGTPSGGVQFNVDGQPFGTAVALSGDTATLTVSNLSTGNHDVVATYNGDADFASSTSATVTHGVNRADSDLSLSTSDASAVSGQALTFTATVTPVAPGSGTPSGSVQFFVDGDPLGAPVALSGGQAVSPTTRLTVGAHAVTANYEGDASFGGSNDVLTQDVSAAATSTSVSSAPNPSVFGQPVTLHADVSVDAPGSGEPTGQVRFVVEGAPDVYVPVSGGVAEATISTLSVGSHAIHATFLSDDPNFLDSASQEITQQVNKAATRTVVTSSAPISVFGQPVTFTATVSVLAPGAGDPSGTVTFTDGATELGTVPVGSGTGFQASLTTSGLSVGQHAITATYSGDDSFLASSGSTSQTVHKAQTSTVLVSSANPAANGQSVHFTATVSPVAPGAGTPTGTVLFTVNGLPVGAPATLVGGVATSGAFASLTPGTYKVKAQYNGDGNFLTSSALLDQGAGLTVTKGATSLALGSGPNPAAYGDPVTFTATVSAVAPATGRPSGVVRFWEGSVLLGSSSLAPAATSSAQATFVSSTLSTGTHAVRAEYVGNFNFEGSTATVAQTIEHVDTVTGIESSANPSTFGDDVTLTAVVSAIPASAASPTGTVTFTEGSTTLGTATLATVGGRQEASITVSGLAIGSHEIVASYSGSALFAAGTSAAFTQVVDRAAPVLRAGVPDRHGEVTATLTGLGGQPLVGETVSFWSHPSDDLGNHLCDAVTDANGIASCDETVINIVLGGSFDGGYDARFAGNGDYLPAEDYAQQF